MTTTPFTPQISPQAAVDASHQAAAAQAASVIHEGVVVGEDGPPTNLADVQVRIQAAIAEMRADIKEREALIHDMWVARIGQLHLLMLGPGGTGKSYAVRRLTQHIIGSKYFERQLDETTDPSEVFGPPDIRAMVDEGKSRRVLLNMFAECTDGFLDEFFNANGPLLHSIMPVLNERIYSSNGVPTSVPLRSCFMGTNKLNADADLAALFDRVHIRHIVRYVADRDNQIALVGDAIARMAIVGRGTSTTIPGQQITTVTLKELDDAHKAALALPIALPVVQQFFDIREELEKGAAQIEISDRRCVEGMAAVMANAWVRGHSEVKVADLDVLANMWWTVQEQRGEARNVILAATNPGEKAALDLLDELDKVKAEIAAINKPEIDDTRKRKVGVEQVRNIDRLLVEATEHLTKAAAAGADTAVIQDVVNRANNEKLRIGKEVFNIDMAAQAAMTAAAGVPAMP